MHAPRCRYEPEGAWYSRVASGTSPAQRLQYCISVATVQRCSRVVTVLRLIAVAAAPGDKVALYKHGPLEFSRNRHAGLRLQQARQSRRSRCHCSSVASDISCLSSKSTVPTCPCTRRTRRRSRSRSARFRMMGSSRLWRRTRRTMAKSWDFASADSSATAIGARRSHKSRFAFHPCHLVVSASFPRRRCVVNAAIESAPQLADCGPNANRLIAAVRTLRRDALRCAALRCEHCAALRRTRADPHAQARAARQ